MDNEKLKSLPVALSADAVEWVKKYGHEVLDVIIQALDLGFTAEVVKHVLDLGGRVLLDVLVQLKLYNTKVSANVVVDGERVVDFDQVNLLKVILDRLITPEVLSKIVDKLISMLLK